MRFITNDGNKLNNLGEKLYSTIILNRELSKYSPVIA